MNSSGIRPKSVSANGNYCISIFYVMKINLSSHLANIKKIPVELLFPRIGKYVFINILQTRNVALIS